MEDKNLVAHEIDTNDLAYEEAMKLTGTDVMMLEKMVGSLLDTDKANELVNESVKIFENLCMSIFDQSSDCFEQMLVLASCTINSMLTLIHWDHNIALKLDIAEMEKEINNE